MYAIRGATTAATDTEKDIRKSVENLMKYIFNKNNLETDDIISIIFSSTHDLTAIYPARIFREMGYDDIPLFSCMEPPIQGSLNLCIRVLIHIRGNKADSNKVKHVYKNEAKKLRPDLLDSGE